jgi:hypothetical protein
MSTPSLRVTLNNIGYEIDRVTTLKSVLVTVPVDIQYLAAETILIRLTSALEFFIADACYKIASGASYLDGSHPDISILCRSKAHARHEMLNRGRSKPKNWLKWTRAKFIKESICNVINPTDNILIQTANYGSFIHEVFTVRNFASHRSTTSRNDFKTVVKNVYGTPRKLRLGQFLLSPNYLPQSNLDRYLSTARAMSIDICKA